MIAGSTVIEDYNWVGPSVTFRDNICIGKNVKVGMSASITKNIHDNETWLGLPAMLLFDLLRFQRKIKKF